MRNAVHYVLDKLDGLDVYHLKKQCDHRIRDAKEHFESAEKAISSIGAKKITNNMIVYTHCHSSTVVNILKQAKLEGKRFVVHNTETRPLLQGRKTAKELAKAKIPVIHFVDSAARLALKKADIVLLGADAITSEGKVINKIGSELIAEAAYHLRIPVYICTDSWKFDPNTIFGYEEEIEQRSGKEVWDSPPKGVHIDNHAFERIHPALISAIISEFGVYRPTVFVEEMRRNYRWMFN
jgi:ribose 1,5-bisphosphate isomerase